ncbi:MAG: aminomethyl transferase family protein [Dehalococcoidia bacterium]|nr:aminomethyl transferase family protein [Dehalococcoidia bacterium]
MTSIDTLRWFAGYDVPSLSLAGRDVPLRWSTLDEEYRAAKQSAAIFDRSYLGRLRATGADVLDLLNRLSTNKVDAIQPGQGAHTALTTNKGRIIDQLTVLRTPGHVLLLTSEGGIEQVAKWLDTYTITEDATFTDVSAETVQFTVVGPKAQQLIGAAFGQAARALAGIGCAVVRGIEGDVLVARTDSLGGATFDMVVPLDMATVVWERLVATGKQLGALPAGEECLETLRVELGVPRYGHELTDRRNPLEAGIAEAISWTKGCYIGQEVIARLRTYHKVQRYLVRLHVNVAEVPLSGAKLLVDGKDAGSLTSVAHVPGQTGVVALAQLRTAFVRQGTEVQVPLPSGNTARGTVTWVPELPSEALTPAQLLALAEEPLED